MTRSGDYLEAVDQLLTRLDREIDRVKRRTVDLRSRVERAENELANARAQQQRPIEGDADAR